MRSFRSLSLVKLREHHSRLGQRLPAFQFLIEDCLLLFCAINLLFPELLVLIIVRALYIFWMLFPNLFMHYISLSLWFLL